jgi:hypothetical protein
MPGAGRALHAVLTTDANKLALARRRAKCFRPEPRRCASGVARRSSGIGPHVVSSRPHCPCREGLQPSTLQQAGQALGACMHLATRPEGRRPATRHRPRFRPDA